MPSRRAISVLDRPVAGITSSRRSSPGCAGQRFESRMAGCSDTGSSSVVLLEIDPDRVAVLKFEGDAPRTVDMNGVAGRVKAVQGVEIEAGQVHVLRPFRDIQAIKPSQDASMHLGVDLRCSPLGPEVG